MGDSKRTKKLLKYDLLRGRKRCPFCHQDGREAELRRRRCGKGEFNKIRYFVECWLWEVEYDGKEIIGWTTPWRISSITLRMI